MKTKVFLLLFLLVILGGFVARVVYLWLSQPGVVYQAFVNASGGVVELVGLDDADPHSNQPEIKPIDPDFSLIARQIGLSAPVVANVDGSNKGEYLWQVKQGIAHYKHLELPEVTVDGSLPGQVGNIFLFGHSQIPGGDTSNFQGVFNDLHRLLPGDLITVYYQGERFNYEVEEGRVVGKDALSYLERTPRETLTLMTCWPLGLDVRRYVVRAKRVP